MKIYPSTMIDARWDLVSTVSLASATVQIQINDEWYPADWLAEESVDVEAGLFMRTAILSVGGRESAAVAKFIYGQQPLVEVSVNGQKIVSDSGSVKVRD